MPKLGISTGTTPNDGTGDTLLSGAIKINSNFNEIYNYFGDGTNLTGAGVTSITAGSGISVDQSTGNVTITATGGGGGGESYWSQTAAGIHTLSSVGIGTTNPTSALIVKGNTSIETLNVSGVSTFPINVAVGVDFAHQNGGFGKFRISGDGIYGNGRLGFYDSSNNLTAAWDSYPPNGKIDIYNYTNSGTQNITISAGSSVVLQHGGTNTKLQTLGTGVTVTGTTFTNQLNVSGVSTFNNLNVSGVSTFSDTLNIATNKALVLGNSTEVQIYRYQGLPNNKTVFYSTSGDFDLDAANGGYSFGNGTYDYAVFSSQSTAFYHKADDIPGSTLRYNTTDSGTEFYKDITVRNSIGTEYFVVKTGAGSSTTEQVKVGIGTTNPTSNLTVRGGDISVGISTAHGLILTSPNGTQYRLIVANDGTLSTSAI